MLISRSSVAIMATVFGIFAANAQQLPNADFETWENCIPWNSKNTTDVQGTTPTDWCISNVVTPGMAAGNATVGKKVEGYNNTESAVNIYNISTAGQTIPGYVTLGTTWATACIRLATIQEGSTDGGTWGGYSNFSYTPDAVSFYYIHTKGSGSDQPASIVAYMWKGQTSQADVPADNAYRFAFTGAFPTATKVTMIDRDRNILGMSTLLGGTVTKSADFELISTINYKLTNVNSEWESLEIPFEYVSDATPTKINLIFSAGDYFADRTAHKKDDALTIDNVKLIYYSRLSSLKINGTEVEGFASDKYDYTVATPYSTDNTIDATVLGRSAKIESVTYNDTDYTVTIKVSNIDADNDGETSHTYVVKFAEPAKTGVIYEGIIKIYMGGDPMELSDQKVVITSTGDDTCDFALENFTLDGNPENSLGDILVKDVKITTANINGKTWSKYTGSAKGVSLAAGEIICDVDLEGYEDANKNLVAFIHVKWIMDPNDAESVVPIEVEFRTNNFETVTGIDNLNADRADATPRYYLINGVEVKEPTAPGLYIVRRGNTIEKLVK